MTGAAPVVSILLIVPARKRWRSNDRTEWRGFPGTALIS